MARCLTSSRYLPNEETKRAHQGESLRVMQQRRAGMQVQGCDARPGACGRAHQGRRWCGRRRRNRRFVDRPLVAHPLAPPSVILPTAPDLRYLPRARVKRSAHARWSSTAPADAGRCTVLVPLAPRLGNGSDWVPSREMSSSHGTPLIMRLGTLGATPRGG